METVNIIAFLEHFSYFAIFLLVFVAGYLFPVPEEVMLICIGYLASTGFGNLPTIMVVSIVGIILGDDLVYFLARFSHRFTQKIKQRLKKSTLQKYETLIDRHANLTIFGTRFIAGLRFLGPFLAGSHKIKWGRFQIFNALALTIYTSLYILLGYHFHTQLAVLISRVEFVQHLVFFVIVILLGLACIYLVRKWILRNGRNGEKK